MKKGIIIATIAGMMSVNFAESDAVFKNKQQKEAIAIANKKTVMTGENINPEDMDKIIQNIYKSAEAIALSGKNCKVMFKQKPELAALLSNMGLMFTYLFDPINKKKFDDAHVAVYWRLHQNGINSDPQYQKVKFIVNGAFQQICTLWDWFFLKYKDASTQHVFTSQIIKLISTIKEVLAALKSTDSAAASNNNEELLRKIAEQEQTICKLMQQLQPAAQQQSSNTRDTAINYGPQQPYAQI